MREQPVISYVVPPSVATGDPKRAITRAKAGRGLHEAASTKEQLPGR